MTKTLLLFWGRLTLILGLALSIQLALQYFFSENTFGNFILQNYSFNYVLTLIFYFIFLWKNEKLIANLGFAFLFFSLLKFILFLVVLYPFFELKNGIKSPEFITFFIPYALCLFYETYSIVRKLNQG
jgi:hypothetical protein